LSERRVGFEADAKATAPSALWRRRAFSFFIVSTILFGPHPAAPKAWTRQDADLPSNVPRYPVDVRAVALDVLVTDRKGRFVPGLKSSDFRVLELGVPQELSFFTASRTPVTVVLLLDSSASVRSDLLSVQKAANRFISKLAHGDRARIGFFHERVVFGPRFTDDMKEHSAMINQMRPQRSTHLYDALVESFEKLEPVPKRKVLLVFSDGEDQGSRTSMQGALEAARRSHASVYPVGLLGWSADDGMYTNQRLLEQIARVTGGRAFFPSNDKEMRKAFDRIRAELHHQYRMGYVPASGDQEPGQWREIQVELTRRKDLLVRCRLGYYSDRPQAP
jgi:Ca-activated chloride channel family protein